jgi:hypothetical protein
VKCDFCIVVVMEFIFQQFQNMKLLFPNPCGRFVGDCLGSYCFRLMKDMSLLGGH